MCQVRIYFFFISTMISLTLVSSLNHSAFFLSLKVTLIIFLSVPRWVILNLNSTLFEVSKFLLCKYVLARSSCYIPSS
uniref:Putative secreted protein n=1 Tax=Rhipicephalus microplus TaxID=6941 RepID=A0A6G5A3U0_RHIMP